MKIRSLLIISFSLFLTQASYSQESAQRGFYEEGDRFKRAGSWAKALNVWERGIIQLQKEGKSDPRAGIAYVELATEKELTFFYEKASELYLLSFGGNNLDTYAEEIAEEASRIAPLLSSDEEKEWQRLVRNKDVSLAAMIRDFWIPSDPSPTTKENERLVEHWERIAHARKEYTKNSTSVYGTDDRGLLFVKYGEPDFSESGQFGLNRGALMNRIGEMLEVLEFSGAERQAQGTATSTNATGDVSLVIQDQGTGTFSSGRTVPDDPSAIAQAIDIIDTKPLFDLWGYDLGSEKGMIYYLFGESGSSSSYGLRTGVEEFIPSRATSQISELIVHNNADGTTAKIYPGAFLQAIYYEQMDKYGGVFAERFADINSMWNRVTVDRKPISLISLQSKRNSYLAQDRDAPEKRYAPQTKTKYDNLGKSIKLLNRQIRMLDENNEAKLIILAMPFFGGFKAEDLFKILSGEELMTAEKLRHTLLIYDDKWNELERMQDESSDNFEDSSVFLVDHKNKNVRYILAAETIDEIDDPELEETLREKLETDQDVFMGKEVLQTPEPLVSDQSVLELSDPVMGVEIPEDLIKSGFPFPVVPADQVSKGDPLHVYLEIYHLLIGQDNKAKFNIDYRIVKQENSSLLRRLTIGAKTPEQVAQSFSRESVTTTSKEKVVFDITEFKTGDYLYEVEVTDTQTGQKKIRSGKFKIIE